MQSNLGKSFIFLLIASVVIVAVLFLIQLGTPTASPRHIILISIDTLRADYLGCYGDSRGLTPNIDKFAMDGLLFKKVAAPVPLTLPSHTTILTGTNPPYHGIHDNFDYVGPSNLTLAEIFKEKGFATGAVISSSILHSDFGLNQGFDTYLDKIKHIKKDGFDIGRRAEDATDLACKWFEENKDGRFFLFLHYYDPHTPYCPPEPYASKYPDNLYAGEVAYTDEHVGRLMKTLKELGIYNSALIILTADHGEMLGEHGEKDHGYFIYESAIKVPLIIKAPRVSRGKRIDNDLVGSVDIFPTICKIMRLSLPEHIQGMDLSDYFTGKDNLFKDRQLPCESLTPTSSGGNSLLGLVTSQWKYIQTTRPELYDLVNDPQESKNLLESQAKRARFMREHLRLLLKEQQRKEQDEAPPPISPETLKRLESLGYVGGGKIEVGYKFNQSKTDPKDTLEFYLKSKELLYLIATEQFKKAEPIAEEMLAWHPKKPQLQAKMGKIAFGLEKMEKAVLHFSKAIELREKQKTVASAKGVREIAEMHGFLSRALLKLDRMDEAIEQFNITLKLQPDSAMVYFSWGNALRDKNKTEEAIESYKKAIELDPNFADAHFNLAHILFNKGDYDQAIVHLTEVVRLEPDSETSRKDLKVAQDRRNQHQKWIRSIEENPNQPLLHKKFGDIYLLEGQYEKAIHHWKMALKLKPDWPEVLNNLAWLKAAFKNKAFHNPEAAIQLAQQACEIAEYKRIDYLDTLAVTYAAAGDFEKAKEIAEKALNMAMEQNNTQLIELTQKHLQLFKNNKPYYDME